MDRIVKRWSEVRNHWSLWLGAVGTAFVTWFIGSPESAVAAWMMLPADLKAQLPPELAGYIGIGLFVLALLAKFVNQEQLRRKAKAP